ncbi:MAG TPA: carboxypeptidase-like regulatory domain-containing protein, partial [Haliangium sp.]|nr:carboxypeptidase-like regulatory domain-containing protein [Haliangium sp.]
AVTNRRLQDARVMIAHEQMHQHRQETDARGRFQFEDLFAGSWQVEVGATGYVTEKFTITVPHRGEYLGARVDLVSVRERIFSMYREVAEPLLPDRTKWGIWTPRQIVDHVREQKPSPVLAALTNFVEESYFSQRTPQETVLAEAAQRMAQARAEQLDAGAA